MGHPENLVSLADRTLEERQAIGAAGGKKSGETKRRRKAYREIIALMDAMPSGKEEIAERLASLGMTDTKQNAVILAQYDRAVDGDTEAMRFLRDTVGEKPTEAYQLAVGKADLSAVDMSTLTNEELAALAETD